LLNQEELLIKHKNLKNELIENTSNDEKNKPKENNLLKGQSDLKEFKEENKYLTQYFNQKKVFKTPIF